MEYSGHSKSLACPKGSGKAGDDPQWLRNDPKMTPKRPQNDHYQYLGASWHPFASLRHPKRVNASYRARKQGAFARAFVTRRDACLLASALGTTVGRILVIWGHFGVIWGYSAPFLAVFGHSEQSNDFEWLQHFTDHPKPWSSRAPNGRNNRKQA